MNDDALAAVVAAAMILVAGELRAESLPARGRWGLAARVRMNDAAQARIVARAPSLWMHGGRRRD